MHRTTIAKVTKFSSEELEQSLSDPLSCVAKVVSNEILSLRPRECGHIVKGVRRCVLDKVGRYHPKVNGIVLGYAKIRVENALSALRTDSPYLHVRATIDFYVFQPRIGSTLRGTVNYVSKEFVSAMIYRVFNVTVKLNRSGGHQSAVKKGCEIAFVVKSCDMKSELPIIEGELVVNGVTVKQEQSRDVVETAVAPKRQKARPINGTHEVRSEVEPDKAKKSKKNKQKQPLEKSAPPVVVNGTNESPPNASAEEGENSADKDEYIQSLLSDMFSDFVSESPTEGAKSKAKSKKVQREPATPASTSVSIKQEPSEVNGESTPKDKSEPLGTLKRKLRFNLSETITPIKPLQPEHVGKKLRKV
ncbi:uncharacterized protein LOC128278415 [Anopheles cruzii]|uniref:uncharacterized protein LOC128278415 n=1 Tax=Anopheles cruzii TaxID=68878 RepID=UPI0022EC63E7|nr:uncharacterized protein LOC128278415 [Anopheles cruzii]